MKIPIRIDHGDSIPESAADLFSGKSLAYVATVSKKGNPLVTPVWVDREGNRVIVNSARGRTKNGNMAIGSPVALTVVDSTNPFRYVSVQGVVEEIRTAGANEQLNRLSERYLGQPTYPWMQPGEVRELFFIKPTRVKLQEEKEIPPTDLQRSK